jgi:hypothetical protein
VAFVLALVLDLDQCPDPEENEAGELHETSCRLAPEVLERGVGHIGVEGVRHARIVVGHRQPSRHAPAALDVLEDHKWSESQVPTVKELLRDWDLGVFCNVLCCGGLLGLLEGTVWYDGFRGFQQLRLSPTRLTTMHPTSHQFNQFHHLFFRASSRPGTGPGWGREVGP